MIETLISLLKLFESRITNRYIIQLLAFTKGLVLCAKRRPSLFVKDNSCLL